MKNIELRNQGLVAYEVRLEKVNQNSVIMTETPNLNQDNAGGGIITPKTA